MAAERGSFLSCGGRLIVIHLSEASNKAMNPLLAEQLHAQGLLSDTSLEKVKAAEAGRLFSVHWELKTLLYLGVLLLSGGLGVLVYKNIDTIGHQAVLAFIAAVSAG